MKKVLLFTMLVAVASLFTSCENPDTKLAQSLVGTWEGYNYFGEDEVDAEYQYFECDAQNAGKFLEVNHLTFVDEVDGIEYEMPYLAYVGGDYSVKDGRLYMNYDPETAEVYFNEDAVMEYVTAYLIYDREKGEGAWAEDTPEDVTEYFIASRSESFGEIWTEMCEDSNSGNSEAAGFGDLKVNETTMSYHASDLGTLKYTRSTSDIFEEYPF